MGRGKWIECLSDILIHTNFCRQGGEEEEEDDDDDDDDDDDSDDIQ